jgi:hypothetical protein
MLLDLDHSSQSEILQKEIRKQTFPKETMSIRVPPLPTREISPSNRAECKGCYKKIASGIMRVKEDLPHNRFPCYYHEGCCPPDTVAVMEESEAEYPEDIRKKASFSHQPR